MKEEVFMERKLPLEIESLHMIEHVLYREFDFSEKSGNLNLTQERILMTINHSENESMASIARKIGLEQGPFSQTVDKLVKLDYIVRVRSQKDRRLVHLHLSEKGNAYANKVQKSMEQHFDKVLGVLSETELDEFSKALGVIKETAERLLEKDNRKKERRI
jgi:DNA-binding MarR family transcriptional regulator